MALSWFKSDAPHRGPLIESARARAEAAAEAKANAAFRAILMGGPGQPRWTPRDYARLAEEGYRVSSIGYACVTYITQRFASLPVRLYRLAPDGDREEVDQHPALDLLARPNPMQTEYEFRELWGVYLLLSGNVYTHAALPGDLSMRVGEPVELWTLRPDKVKVVQGDWLNPVQGYEYQESGTVSFPRDVVGHARLPNPLDPFYGMSPLEAAARGIDQFNAAGAWNAAMLQNRAEPAGLLNLRGQVGTDQVEKFRRSWAENQAGPENARRTLVFRASDGVEYVRLALTALEMDWKEGKIASMIEVCQAFQVPGQCVGVPGQQTYNNMEQAHREGYTGAILPLAGRYCDFLTHWLLPKFYPGGKADPNVFFWYDDSAVSVLQEDEEKRAKRAALLFEKNVITQKQACRMAGEDDTQAADLYAYQITKPTASGAQQAAQEAMDAAKARFGPRVLAALGANGQAGRN